MTIANLVIRFATELAGIGAIAYAAFQIEAPIPLRGLVAIVAAAAFGVAWAALVAPRRTNGLPPLAKDLLGSSLLLAAAGSLAWTGHPDVAVWLAGAVLLNTVLLVMLGTEPRDRLARMPR